MLPCHQHRYRGGEGRARRARGDAHALQLDLVLGPADDVERQSQVGAQGRVADDLELSGERRPETSHRPLPAGAQPHRQLAERHPARVAFGGARPQPVVLGDLRHEVKPALLRVKGEHPTWAVAIGEVVVLGVGVERVGPVAAARNADGIAGADQDDLIDESPLRRDGAAAAVQGLLDPRVGHRRESTDGESRAARPRTARRSAGREVSVPVDHWLDRCLLLPHT